VSSTPAVLNTAKLKSRLFIQYWIEIDRLAEIISSQH